DFIAAQAPDILFVPSLFEGFWDAMVTGVEPAPYRTAVLIHDFIPLDNPRQYLPGPGIRAAYHRKMRAAASADLLLANSRHTAGEAVARLGVPDARILTIPLGIDPGFVPPPPGARADDVLASSGIERAFVLNTSPFEPRKNLEGLIAGFAAMPPALRAQHQLVIVGRMDTVATRALHDAAARSGLPKGTLVLPGFVPDADLVTLYGATALFAFPSFGEGFGLPLLEAMACGAPVIGSDSTSIPEVIGREDLLCDPADPAAIGAAMARVLGDPALTAALRIYGPARAAKFSWTGAAEIMLDRFAAMTAEPPASVPVVVAAPPCPVRPTLAFVTDGWPVSRVETVTRRLDRHFMVTPVLRDGRLADSYVAANFTARDFAWFERHAPAFDHILYAADAPDGAIGGLITEFPGTRLDAATVTALSSPDRQTAAIATLRDAILRGDGGRPDHRRDFAVWLPRAVRDVRPSDDDLGRLARALARNEAYRRPPRVLIDLTVAAREMRMPLLAALAEHGDAIGGVIAHDGILRSVALGEEAADYPMDLQVRLRAGDCLIGVDRLGGVSAALDALHDDIAAKGAMLLTIDTSRATISGDRTLARAIVNGVLNKMADRPELGSRSVPEVDTVDTLVIDGNEIV
ncbi:MAG: glycosyltransferase family 1 protein, partial [Rhizorhabdus sp.]